MSQTGRDALFIGTDYRQNFKQIIAKRSDIAVFSSGRMVFAAPGTTITYPAGTVVGIVTVGGLLKPYLAASADGSQVPVGILSEDVFTDEFGNGSEAVYLSRAIVFKDFLIGLDANAITLLKASASVEHGTNLLSFYA